MGTHRINRKNTRRALVAGAAAAAVAGGWALMPTAGASNADEPAAGKAGAEPAAASLPVAPYLYNGWGSPPDPAEVMNATGVGGFTLAFVLSNGTCDPQWDGQRPLTGGADEETVNAVRAAGGDVVPSFGGWSGNKLESSCGSAEELAAAYQKVIDAYDLKAIDIDLEADAYDSPEVQQRTVDALKAVKEANSGLEVVFTIGTGQDGPDTSLIDRAAESQLDVDVWTIMPFNFGGNDGDMGQLSIQASEGLKGSLQAAYGYGEDEVYQRMGISSMNGNTDVGEVVDQDDFRTMLGYAQDKGLGRLTFWSANRDRPCGDGGADTCGGIPQEPWEFTSILAEYQG